MSGGLTSVVAGAGLLLVAASPAGPGQRADEVAGGFDDQHDEQAPDLRAGQHDQVGTGRGRVSVVAAVTASRAWAIMASRVQGGVRRSISGPDGASSPARPLPVWKASSTAQRHRATSLR
jgi:hypothetical protein